MKIAATHYLIAICIFCCTALLQSQDIKFEHLTVDDGLSNNYIRSIAQDNMGFMWFATEDGLNKYDGYTFTVYRYDPDNASSLRMNGLFIGYPITVMRIVKKILRRFIMA